jgi:hypothetical protein
MMLLQSLIAVMSEWRGAAGSVSATLETSWLLSVILEVSGISQHWLLLPCTYKWQEHWEQAQSAVDYQLQVMCVQTSH